MARLLITGASGDLGRPLSALAARGWDTVGTYYRNPLVGGGQAAWLDLREREGVLRLVRAVRPDAIIHAATSDSSKDMANTNRLAACHIAEAASSVGCRLIALSTDMVFDGTRAPYAEDAPPTPVGPYAQVKADNETRLLAAHHNCLIVRTSLIYDLTPLNKQVAWMERAIAAGQPVALFEDEMRQPIWAWNLAEALLELAQGSATGILHVAGPEPISRWELGRALLKALGYDPCLVAHRARAAEIAPDRPRTLILKLDRAHTILRTPLLPLHEALRWAKAET